MRCTTRYALFLTYDDLCGAIPSYMNWHNSTLHLSHAQFPIFTARKTRIGARDVLDLLTKGVVNLPVFS